MEEVLGGHTADNQFAVFLTDWEAILARRVEEAVAAFGQVKGLHGLILAGGLGRGAPWPLSDIDLIPIYADDRPEAAAEIEMLRLAFLERWIAEGWWSGLDIGRLRFSRREVQRARSANPPALSTLLADDRWYHTMDKAFGGCTLIDLDGIATSLVAWFSALRFTPAVVAYRLQREQQELVNSQHAFALAVNSGDMLAATGHLRNAAKWLFTLHLERWGERDNSQGRIGTRFVTAAHAHGADALVDTVHALSDLVEPQVWQRLATAPPWVRERHDRSLRARLHVGEPIAPLADARDTLRVCSLYALRRETTPPYPEWLAILDQATAQEYAAVLQHVITTTGKISLGSPPGRTAAGGPTTHQASASLPCLQARTHRR